MTLKIKVDQSATKQKTQPLSTQANATQSECHRQVCMNSKIRKIESFLCDTVNVCSTIADIADLINKSEKRPTINPSGGPLTVGQLQSMYMAIDALTQNLTTKVFEVFDLINARGDEFLPPQTKDGMN